MELTKNPKVSVIIPTYNRAKFIEKTALSVINQTYPNKQVVIVDDGSTDGTKKVVDKLIKKYGGMVKYIYKKNGGCASALNEGILHSDGELIGWLSSDDWYDFDDNKIIEKSVEAHKQDKAVGMTYCDYTVVEPDKEWVYNSFESDDMESCFNKMLEVCYICGSSMIIKKEVFYTVGNFNAFFKYAQDYEFYLRILTKFKIKKVHFEKKPMLNYYYNPQHECLGKKIQSGEEDNEAGIVRERYSLMFEKGRPRVCALVCAKDEEELIDQCLNDLHMYVDHICVIDDGSTDKTPELLLKWKKVDFILRQQPKGNLRTEGIDRQRLLELGYSTNPDYFLFIDVDEYFEDRYKTEIFKEMKKKSVNLWFYKEINFWRNAEYHRIDELYNSGWFGRLFKAMPGLNHNTGVNEHCGGIPNNIPDTPMWFEDKETQEKSMMRVKHYGFSTEKRILEKFRKLWERESYNITLIEKQKRYLRLLNEDTLKLNKYYERPYWLKSEADPPPKIIEGEEFGFSDKMKKELEMANSSGYNPRWEEET